MTSGTRRSLGDVARAFAALAPASAQECRAIARTLGFDFRVEMRPRSEVPASGPRPQRPQEASTAPAPLVVPAVASPSEGEAIDLIPIADVRDNEVASLNPLARPTSFPRDASSSPAPLLTTTWSRAIIGRLTGCVVERGNVDVDRLVRALASYALPRTLPRLRRLASATRLTVVLDGSGAGEWLWRDAEQLVEQIRRVVRAPMAVLRTEGPPKPRWCIAKSPLDEEDVTANASQIAVPATRVIGLTDLGLADAWRPREPAWLAGWRDFARALRSLGSSLLVLTPVPMARIPSWFRRDVACVPWDRATRPSTVYRQVKGLG